MSGCCCGGKPSPATEKPESVPAGCCAPEPQATCCASPVTACLSEARWVVGSVETPAGSVPVVTTRLAWPDTLGTWRARWGVGRMDYAVPPGLYAVGDPTAESPVFVSANYKMSFDVLRSSLDGISGWVLVLDTKGVNVWCAAGKGTFGTEELVRRIAETRLADIVSHRQVIVPQLGAVGVSAHKVREASGFRVVYGPVRADDIGMFLDAGLKATPEMRRVRFGFRDRMTLVPVELVGGWKHLAILALIVFALSGLGLPGGYSFEALLRNGPLSLLWLAIGAVAATVFGPALLPYLPGRAFATKGVFAGGVGFALMAACWFAQPTFAPSWLAAVGWLLLAAALGSFALMNYTGSSTYTSLSGVLLETRVGLRAQVVAAALGAVLLVAGRFV